MNRIQRAIVASQFLVHLTKNFDDKNALDNLKSIIRDGQIEARNSYGFASKLQPDAPKQVCFSEIPFDNLWELLRRRSKYGIVFEKGLVRLSGGNPIHYVQKNSVLNTAVLKLRDDASGDLNNTFWDVAPFIDVVGDFPSGPYKFQWEREWRLNCNMKFDIEDIALIIAPEKSTYL